MRLEPFSLPRLREIVDLGRRMHEESSYAVMPFDMEQAAQSIHDMVLTNPYGYGMTAIREGKMVGMLAGGMNRHFFADVWYAFDHVWYVPPEHRGSTTAIRLLRDFENWAKGRGARYLNIGITTRVEADRTGSVLERSGFDRLGGNYRKKL